ncbi:hypothetical protein LWI29_028589 [Acer saccharum]|uniref:Reverse transcriptase Ty1/copia-type domain-containing protein n=1 Tax=Acer saccharum TaxID=4024 RepID=A0AA39T9W3_ACESA|nr:hypothetical protein LWI29_028589 [Acer saccharum]
MAWGFVNSTSDTSLFLKFNGSDSLFLLVYVDDILITGSDSGAINKLISTLHNTFALKTLGQVNFFLGFEAFRDSTGLYLTQSKYVLDLLKKTNMLESKPIDTPIAAGTKLSLSDGIAFSDPTLYRSTVGALQYLTNTRPDISFVVNKLSQFLAAPTLVHWQACKRVLRYIKGTPHIGLWFQAASVFSLEAFSDADRASCIDDCRSTSGNCVLLGGNLISWSSRKQRVVARSSTEAEYRSMAQVTTDVIWLRSLLHELRIPVVGCPVVWCDNIGANSLSQNPVFHQCTKHIDIDTHFIREKVLAGEIDTRYVPTAHQIADILTKGFSRDRFQFLCAKLNLVASPQFSLREDDKPIDSSSKLSASIAEHNFYE